MCVCDFQEERLFSSRNEHIDRFVICKYLTCVGAKQMVHAYDSVTCRNQHLLAPFDPKSSVSYKDVSTISKLTDKRSPN